MVKTGTKFKRVVLLRVLSLTIECVQILKARFKCCVANCNFSVLPNPSAPPASCPEVALPDSQDNLEVTSEVSEGCVDICCGCDSRYKWYDEEGKGILSRRGPCCE